MQTVKLKVISYKLKLQISFDLFQRSYTYINTCSLLFLIVICADINVASFAGGSF